MKLAKFLSLILAISMLLCVFTGCTSNETDKNSSKDPESNTSPETPTETPADQFVWKDTGSCIEITQYLGSAKEVVVPEIINNKKVISVGSTFNGNVVLESLVLPAYCYAELKHCENLKKLTVAGDLQWFETSHGNVGFDHVSSIIDEGVEIRQISHLDIPHTIETLIVNNTNNYHVGERYGLSELSISSATEIIGGRLENDATVTISDSIKYAVIFDESEEGGGICYCLSAQKDVKNFTRSESASIECIELNEENKAEYYCKVFGCEKVTVNGKTYTYDLDF